MSVDLYAVCPCGNGKKIKFCKCKESVDQMDKVLTMIEGGQMVPGLDRLKSILDEHPDAAWALAIRGRLLLDLREYESLSENADRFIRLQPSNPLALTQRAAALVFNQDVQGATDALLEALNESGQEVDAFLMDVALIVAMGLAQAGVILSARVYALLAISSQGYEAEQANAFLSQMDTSPGVNHLLKSIPQLIERPADVPWGERCDEAVGLLRSNRVLLAQDKFESLRRSAPGQPAILSGLLHCAVWRGNLERQTEMANQLSEVESLDAIERQRYRAIAGLLSPIGTLSINSQTVRVEFEDIDQAEMALIASDRTEQLSADRLSQIQVPEGEVRPRSAFFISDQAIDSDATDVAPADCPASLSLLTVYGRQTDRSAQAVAYDVTEDRVAEIRDVLMAAIPTGNAVLEDPQPIPMTFALDDRPIRHSQPNSMAELAKFNRDFAATHDGKRVCQLPLPILDGKSLATAADDDSLSFQRAVVVRVLEGHERIISLEQALADVYEISKVDPLPMLEPTDETVSDLLCADFFRVNPDKLSPMQLYVLASNARSTGGMTACNRFAKKLVEVATAEDAPEGDPRIAMEGYVLSMLSTAEPSESIEIGDKAIAYAKKNGLNHATILLSRLELCLSMADQDGFRQTIMDIEKDYGNDPTVMARVQQLLVQLGIIRPDGSLRQQGGAPAGGPATEFTPAAPPEQRGGGVWTPDQPNPPGPSGDEGGSKLWVPGMD
ncbi:protein-disulfide isomerase [Stieleria sp. TO1_6]|uniref:tetratricopeptide repeat protein n=1 Tax=Stieleria tagensis TaxID=2956795 RepID=UPI00209A6B58|nr:protein-disulfide isomerase [Stieleria tagensis]MCO8122268.1 protein-disulfide isomerase [Stieleria tagensis]